MDMKKIGKVLFVLLPAASLIMSWRYFFILNDQIGAAIWVFLAIAWPIAAYNFFINPLSKRPKK